MVKILAAILAVILVVVIGYMAVNSVINLFKGYSLSDAINASWHDITHLFGLIKDKVEADVIYPMANRNIIWIYAKATNPR